jgi:hypothetical protein
MVVGQAKQLEEARKAAEDKAATKKRKRDEIARTWNLSPKSLEKKRRKEKRDAIKNKNCRAWEREEERQKLPVIAVGEEGVPTVLLTKEQEAPSGRMSPTIFHKELNGGLSQRKSKRE